MCCQSKVFKPITSLARDRDKPDYHVEKTGLVELTGRGRIGELGDRAGDPAPDRRAFMIADGLELVVARGALGLGFVA